MESGTKQGDTQLPVVATAGPQPVQGFVVHPGYPQAAQSPSLQPPPQWQPAYHVPAPEDTSRVPLYSSQPQWDPVPRHALPPSSRWSSELFDCGHDMNSTADLVFCCHHCQASRQYNMVTNGIRGFDPLSCSVTFAVDLMAGFHLGTFFLTWHLRQRLRTAYNIPSSHLSDCLESFFCLPCALCQHYRELSGRGDWPGGTLHDTPYIAPPATLERMGGQITGPHFHMQSRMTMPHEEHNNGARL